MLSVFNNSSSLSVCEIKRDCKIEVKKDDSGRKLSRYEEFILANNKKAISKCANATIFTDAYIGVDSLIN